MSKTRLDIRIEGARLHLENAARQYRKPPLGEPAQVSTERLCKAAIELAKLLDQRDALLMKAIGR